MKKSVKYFQSKARIRKGWNNKTKRETRQEYNCVVDSKASLHLSASLPGELMQKLASGFIRHHRWKNIFHFLTLRSFKCHLKECWEAVG